MKKLLVGLLVLGSVNSFAMGIVCYDDGDDADNVYSLAADTELKRAAIIKASSDGAFEVLYNGEAQIDLSIPSITAGQYKLQSNEDDEEAVADFSLLKANEKLNSDINCTPLPYLDIDQWIKSLEEEYGDE